MLKNVNFKEKKERKAFIISLIIVILISQSIALIIWLIFNENFFFPLFFGAIVGLIFGYKGLKKK